MRKLPTLHYADAAVKQVIEDNLQKNKDQTTRDLENVTSLDIAAVCISAAQLACTHSCLNLWCAARCHLLQSLCVHQK
jgi:hypothetical protein